MKNVVDLVEKYRRSSKIFKASIWFVGASIFNNCVSIITQPIINRILSVEEIGLYNVFNTWHSLFLILATLNLFAGVLEVLLTEEFENSNNIIASLSSLTLITSCIFFSCILIFYPILKQLVSISQKYIVLMCVYIMSEAIIQFWCSEKRFCYSYKAYSVILIGLFVTKSFLSILFSIIIAEDRVFGRILGLVIPSLTIAIFLYWNIRRNSSLKKISQYWRRAVLFNLPLIPHYLTSILMSSADRIMIQQLSTMKNVGLYSVVYTYSSIVLIAFNSINSAYTPFALKAIKKGKINDLKIKTNYVVWICTIAAFCMMILAPEGLIILGGNEYLKAADIAPIILLGIFFSSFYYIFSNVEFVYKKNKIIFPVTLVGAVINIGLNYLLIPRWGYQAAAYTTLISYIFIFFSHWIISYRIVKKQLYDYKCIILVISFLSVIAIFAEVLFSISLIIRLLIIVLLMLGCLYIIKKGNIFSK